MDFLLLLGTLLTVSYLFFFFFCEDIRFFFFLKMFSVRRDAASVLATKVGHLFPSRCEALQANQLFCDISSSVLLSAKRIDDSGETFIDSIQRPEVWRAWPNLLRKFQVMPAHDVGRATERLVQLGSGSAAVKLHEAWLMSEMHASDTRTFPFEFPNISPCSLSSGLALRMVYLNMRGAVISGDFSGGAVAKRMREGVLAGSVVGTEETRLWHLMMHLMASAAVLDARSAEFRSEGKFARHTVKQRCAADVHCLLQAYNAASKNATHVFELVFNTYESCSRFSTTSRVKLGSQHVWKLLMERLWWPAVTATTLQGCAADTLMTLYTTDVFAAPVSSKSFGRQQLVQRVLDASAASTVSRRIEALLSRGESQWRVATPAPQTVLTTLRARDGSDSIEQICLDAEEAVRRFLSGAYENWERGVAKDLPPAAVFLKLFRLMCRCGNPSLVMAVLDDVAPHCFPVTAKMLVHDCVVAVSRSGRSPTHVPAIIEYSSRLAGESGVSDFARDRAALTSLMLEPLSGLSAMLPRFGESSNCKWWAFYRALQNPGEHAPAVAGHLSTFAALVEIPLPVGALGGHSEPLLLAEAVFGALLMTLRAELTNGTAGESMHECRQLLLAATTTLSQEQAEWQLFVLLSCALDAELVGSIVMRCPCLPRSARLLGLVSRLFLELGIDGAAIRHQAPELASRSALVIEEMIVMLRQLCLDAPSGASAADVARALMRLGSHVLECAAALPASDVDADAHLGAFVGTKQHQPQLPRRPGVVFPSIQIDGGALYKGRRFAQRNVRDALHALSLHDRARQAVAGHMPGSEFSAGVLLQRVK